VIPIRALGAFAPSAFRVGAAVADAGQDDGITVGKLRDKGEPAAHGFDIVGQGGQQHIRALFKTRDSVLGDPHASGETDLRALAGAAQLLPDHFLGDQLVRAGQAEIVRGMEMES